MTPCSRQNENVQWSHQAEIEGAFYVKYHVWLLWLC